MTNVIKMIIYKVKNKIEKKKQVISGQKQPQENNVIIYDKEANRNYIFLEPVKIVQRKRKET